MMKKLLALFATGLIIAPGYAQLHKSLVRVDNHELTSNKTVVQSAVKSTPSAGGSNRGTASQPAWMNYANSQYQEGISNVDIYPTYQDSNLVTTTGVYIGYYGFGFSFDPTSSGFTTDAVNPDGAVSFKVGATNAYSVDSVEVMGYYDRRPTSTSIDTLYVEVVLSGSPSTFQLQFSAAPDNSSDGIARFNTALYDPTRNRMSDSVTSKMVIKKVLNAATFGDSTFFSNDIGYLHKFRLKLPSTINAGAGQKIVAFAHFVSGIAQPLNTPIENSNLWYQFTNEPLGASQEVYQKNGETTTGLIVTKQIRYTPSSATFQGHHFIYPTIGYAADASFDYPWFGFHVACASCATVGIENINNTLRIGQVHPNPANNTVSVPVTMKSAANVNVTITNTVGQSLATQNLGQLSANQTKNATFSTSTFANGIYFLTVEANGARTTSRFVVAH